MNKFMKSSVGGYFITLLIISVLNLFFMALKVNIGIEVFAIAILCTSFAWLMDAVSKKAEFIMDDEINIDLDWISSIEEVEDIRVISAEIKADDSIHLSLEIV